MAGLHKGNSNGNRSGYKPYGMMLLLAFGAALLGVMMIHKLRERRIFNLLVKEKDHQLISLQLLLQKEREYTKEMKKKAEEMQAKIYSLRSQNVETDRKILEMLSTIHYLKDERKILESALEERQNNIGMNRKKITGQEKENPQATALMDSLKQKVAEIEDLKRHPEISLKRRPVGADNDLPNSKPNIGVTGNSVDNGTRSAQSRSYSGMRSAYGQELTVGTDEQMGLKISEQDTGRDEGTFKGRLKLEMAESSITSNAKMKDKYVKEKPWRKLAQNRRLVNNMNDENSEADGIGKRKITIHNQNQMRDREEATTYNNGNTDEQTVIGVNNQLEITKLKDLSHAELLKSQNSEDSKDMKIIPAIEAAQHANGGLNGEAAGTRGNAAKEIFGSDGVQYESQENKSRDTTKQNSAAQEITFKEGTDEDNRADMATEEFYRESLPDLEEDKELKIVL